MTRRSYLPFVGLALVLMSACTSTTAPVAPDTAELSDTTLEDSQEPEPADSAQDSLAVPDGEAPEELPGEVVEDSRVGPGEVTPPADIEEPPPAVLPRIRVGALASGEGIFEHSETGERFVPRGNNYVRLHPPNPPSQYHATFAPEMYDGAAAELALAAMAEGGYNLVRVFIDPGDMSRSNGINGAWENPGLDGEYLDNVADFILRATGHQLYVLPVLNLFPFNAHYESLAGESDPMIEGINAYYLAPGHLAAKAQYLKDFLGGLSERMEAAYFSSLFGLSLDDEMYFYAHRKPFVLSTGIVTTADGGSYSMADAEERQAAADSNSVHYVDQMVAAVHTVDPEMLLTVGMFTFQSVGKSGPTGLLPLPWPGQEGRFPVRPAILSAQSQLSFLDVHTYPGTPEYSLSADLGSSEWAEVANWKPSILGDFGAYKQRYPDASTAATAMRDHQVASCGLRIQGWLFWTWDTEEQGQFWNAQDGNAAIDQQLQPAFRPDPCVP